LSKDALVQFIERYLRDEMPAHDIETIAEAFDANDRVAIEEEHRQPIVNALFHLSSTDINGQLSAASAREVLATLTRPDR
jgi:hypothetical protein